MRFMKMALETAVISENESMKGCEGTRDGTASRGSKEPLCMPDLGSLNTSGVLQQFVDSSERQGAALLLSVAAIVSKEIDSEGVNWEDDVASLAMIPTPSLQVTHRRKRTSTLRVRNYSESSSDEDEDGVNPAISTSHLEWNRIRAVSIDDLEEDEDGDVECSEEGSVGFPSKSTPIVSPLNSPVTRKLPLRKSSLRALSRKRSVRLPPVANGPSSGKSKRPLQPNGVLKGNAVKTILRKKFSWKNYPELEAFLIANREEYLRHSALNYTVQQKQYNNRLTERLLELAAEHGYVFDADAFSFVTVRDRIRCYFKSYVQSAKKRGLIIGYAARKAGLLTEDDLEKSAGVTGRIITPSMSKE